MIQRVLVEESTPPKWVKSTLQPLYNTVCYNMVLDITRFKDGSQKCVDYIEKRPFMVIFQYILYIFIWI